MPTHNISQGQKILDNKETDFFLKYIDDNAGYHQRCKCFSRFWTEVQRLLKVGIVTGVGDIKSSLDNS